MGQALLGLLPLSLAAALSTVPVTAAIVILLSDNRRRSGLAFLTSTLLGTLVVVTLATLASQALPGRTRQHDALIGRLEIVIGAAMVLLGVVALARRTGSDAGHGTGWLDGVGSLGMLPVFGIGLALCIRPKAALLALAAGLAINRANLSVEEERALVLLYTALGTSTVVVPILATVLFPHQTEPRLVAAKREVGENHPFIVGADGVQRYFTVMAECAMASKLRLGAK